MQIIFTLSSLIGFLLFLKRKLKNTWWFQSWMCSIAFCSVTNYYYFVNIKNT
jgi:hypothetical protein